MTPDNEDRGAAPLDPDRPEAPQSPGNGLQEADAGNAAEERKSADTNARLQRADIDAGHPDVAGPTGGLPAERLLTALWLTPARTHQIGVLRRPGTEFENIPVSGADEVLALAAEHSRAGRDVYLACSEFASPASRKSGNAVGACAFWLDIDCGEKKAAEGKGYADKDEALAALDQFVIAGGLPAPTHIVDSGSGLHVYWALTAPVAAADWNSHAQQFKRLTQRLAFLVDQSRTADISSVLRIPGTLNHKYAPPKPVTLIEASAASVETGVMLASIEAAFTKTSPAPSAIAVPATGQPRVALQTHRGVVDTAALRSALGSLDPDCEDHEWKIHRIAPLAAAARDQPDQADVLKEIAREFSSGALRGRPSVKWRTPGATNALTGEQVFEQQWQRFLGQPYQGTPVTVATIFHDARKAGWNNPTDAFTEVTGYVEIAAGDGPGQIESNSGSGIAAQSCRLSTANFPDQPVEGKGPLPSTMANFRHLLQRYGINVRYNVIKKKVRISIPGHSGSVDNADNVALTKITSLAILNGLGSGQVGAYVEALADESLYNPAADWILSQPWDGVDRLPAMYATLETRVGFPEDLKFALIYRWLLSAVAAALKPSGFKARGVLTLQGPQGIGKTSWVMSLIADPVLRDMLVKVDHHLDPSMKDSVLGAISHWIVEIGELDSSFRKDMARLKGVLTSDADKIRRPYARTESEYQRRTVFMATVNEAAFLVDNTGNSRWWTLPVVKVDYRHGIDMQQVFAQLAADFRSGAQWWLTREEDALLAKRNERHRSLSAIEEKLMANVDLQQQEGLKKQTALQVLAAVGIEKPANSQSKEANAFLRRYLGEPKRIKGNNYWLVAYKELPLGPDPEPGSAEESDDDGS